jgi:cytochrome oxidase Cu insertion factor (SCO1/SenC/PrrC family)
MSIHADRITAGMTIATIPSVTAGTTTVTTGRVDAVERYTIGGQQFADITVTDSDGHRTTLTNMSGMYDLVSA